MSIVYSCWGPRDGGCHEQHRTRERARRHVEQCQARRAADGGTDRFAVEIDTTRTLRDWYDQMRAAHDRAEAAS